jgi:CheY-like chemotaxis protein
MYKVLIVDDQEDVRTTLKNIVREEGYEVDTAVDPNEGLDKFLQVPFDFALVDVRLMGGDEEDNSGLTLAMTFKTLRPATVVILFTKYDRTQQIAWAVRYHGVFDFIQKTPDFDRQVLGSLKDAQREMKIHETERDTSLSICLEAGRPPAVRAQGKYTLAHREDENLKLDVVTTMERADFSMLTTPNWRSIKRLGEDLWKNIFNAHPGIISAFQATRTKSERMSIIFETRREELGLPLEFMRMTNPDEYLVLKYPMTRMVSDISPQREIISPEWLALRKQLSVLVVASNTDPKIPGVDREADAVRTFLSQQDYIPVQVKYMPTEDATIDNVRVELASQSYDIIHYAGHGWYDANHKDASAIYFWGDTSKSRVVAMNTAELTNLLSTSRVRLIYLSCCSSSATGTYSDGRSDDFLGLADAVIQAGVPSALGFRAPVDDMQAIKLAKYFYRHLLERGSMDVALWEARRNLASENRDDPTWLSPILISQH